MLCPLLNVIRRLSCLAMVDYYGTLKKKIQTMSYLFWLATHDLCQHSALEILRRHVNIIPALLCFLPLVNLKRMIL